MAPPSAASRVAASRPLITATAAAVGAEGTTAVHGDASAAVLHPVALTEAVERVDEDEGVAVEGASLGLGAAALREAADPAGALARARRHDPPAGGGGDADTFLGATSSAGEVGAVSSRE